MRTACALLALALPLCRPAPALGQNAVRELRGEVFSVENGDEARQFFRNVTVVIVESGASGLTNDHGYFRIQSPAPLTPGQEVTLRHNKKGYAISHPLLGKQLVPADPAKVVEIRMLPERSKRFWTDEHIEEFIARTASELAKQVKGRQEGKPDLSAFILELARHYGFTEDEVKREIGKWMETARKDVNDFRKQGMVAFAEKNFRLAGENFRRGAREKEQQAAKNLRDSASDRELAGDSFYSARDFHEALKEYENALHSLNVYRDSLGALGIQVYPEHTADVWRISLKRANAKSDLGAQVSGADSPRHLTDAVEAYKSLVADAPKSTNPRDWAMTQNNLGNALESQGARLGGAEGVRRLGEAVEAYQAALTVRTREALPQDWAMTQNNLGTALRSQGARLGGAEGVRRLGEAVEAYRAAFTVRTREALPRQWARTQNNLRIALQAQIRVGGFPACLAQINKILPEEGIRNDPVAVASLQTLAIVCQVGMDQREQAGRALTDLVAHVGRQPDDFHLVWKWDDLRTFLNETDAEAVKAHRKALLRLIDAVSGDNRDAILKGLKEVQGAFTGRAEGAKGATRE